MGNCLIKIKLDTSDLDSDTDTDSSGSISPINYMSICDTKEMKEEEEIRKFFWEAYYEQERDRE